jgi:hypothetical protein
MRDKEAGSWKEHSVSFHSADAEDAKYASASDLSIAIAITLIAPVAINPLLGILRQAGLDPAVSGRGDEHEVGWA